MCQKAGGNDSCAAEKGKAFSLWISTKLSIEKN